MSSRARADNGASANSVRTGTDCVTRHQLVGPESFPVEEHAVMQPERLIELRMLDFAAQLRHIDTQLRQQRLRNRRVRARAVDLQRAAIHQVQPAAELKLVALGMAAEVIVIVEDQNSGSRR